MYALSHYRCARNSETLSCSARQDLFAQIVTHHVKMLHGIGSALSVAADLVIVGAMLFYMQPARNPGMAKADGWYERTVVYGFNRGTAFTYVIDLVLSPCRVNAS